MCRNWKNKSPINLTKENNMRNMHWIIALILASSLGIGSAMAAEAATETGKLKTISGVPADMKHDHEKCAMHKDKEKCDHKHGEPCPYHDKGHHDKKHHEHMHEKCDHESDKQ
jgi:hypothetical protein